MVNKTKRNWRKEWKEKQIDLSDVWDKDTQIIISGPDLKEMVEEIEDLRKWKSYIKTLLRNLIPHLQILPWPESAKTMVKSWHARIEEYKV